MPVFNPTHTYTIWLDFTGANPRQVKADRLEVTPSGALIFSSRGDDGVYYITTVVAAHAYAHFEWDGSADDRAA